MLYRNFWIERICPPIPDRSHDYQYTHIDYDGWEDRRIGTAPSLEAAMHAIDEWHWEREG